MLSSCRASLFVISSGLFAIACGGDAPSFANDEALTEEAQPDAGDGQTDEDQGAERSTATSDAGESDVDDSSESDEVDTDSSESETDELEAGEEESDGADDAMVGESEESQTSDGDSCDADNPCPQGVCVEGACLPCVNASDGVDPGCEPEAPACLGATSPMDNRCVECEQDSDCGGLVCSNNECVLCDPTSHHGCEESGEAPLCFEGDSPQDNACVECLEEGAVRPGTSECGDAEVLEQECLLGVWIDTERCVAADGCDAGETRLGSTTCGPNGRGLLEQRCSAGAWADTAECIDWDECEDGASQLGTTSCGSANDGVLVEECVEGLWADSATCVDCDPDVDTFRCQGGNSEWCTEAGTWSVDEVCSGDTPACLDSTGLCGLCEQGQTTCLDGVTAGACDANGTFQPQDCDYACVGAGTCGGVCVPGELRCGTAAPEECGVDGQWAAQPACPNGQACDEDTGECTGVPNIVSFDVDVAAVNVGDSATLSWTVTGADQSDIAPGASGVTGVQLQVFPTRTTTYTLDATNEAGTSSATITVHVVAEGAVTSVRHYGTSDTEGARDVVVDEANDRIVTLNWDTYAENGQAFHLAQHSITTGAFQSRADSIPTFVSDKLRRDGSDFLVVGYATERNDDPAGGAPTLSRLGSDLDPISEHWFYIQEPFWEFAYDVAAGANGNYYVAGVSAPASMGYIAEVNAALSSETLDLHDEFIQCIAVDGSERLYVAGSDGYLARFTTSNTATSTRTGNLGTEDDVYAIEIDSSGSVIVAGRQTDVGAFVAKYGPDLGSDVWRVDFPESQVLSFEAVTLDTADNVIVAGNVEVEGQESNVVVVAFDSAGNLLWGPIQRGSSGEDYVGGVAADSRGSVFVAGESDAPMSGSTGYSDGIDGFIIHIQ